MGKKSYQIAIRKMDDGQYVGGTDLHIVSYDKKVRILRIIKEKPKPKKVKS